MRIEDIDAGARQVAAEKRKQLEDIYVRIRLKRLEKGAPINPGWATTWRNYINKAVADTVAQHIASRKLR